MTQPTAIIGAGLAGLIAAHTFPGVPLLEAAPRGAAPHRALLRFRTDAVSRLTGIPFRRVRVHKGIWFEGRYVPPDVRVANLYARKVLGRAAGDRSIWAVEPVDRWVAPETLIEQMTEAAAPRTTWGERFDFGSCSPRAPVVSTAPMAHALVALDLGPLQLPQLERAPIWTYRYRVHCADIHQTVYFPGQDTPVYRASVTGDLLIVESAEELSPFQVQDALEHVAAAMGLSQHEASFIDSGSQRFGKIVPLPDAERRAWLSRLTVERGVYSLGRFATWRNVLLDDVVKDAEVIRGLLRAGSPAYAALRLSAG